MDNISNEICFGYIFIIWLESFTAKELWFYEATTKRGGIQCLAGRFKDRRPERRRNVKVPAQGFRDVRYWRRRELTRWRLGTKSKSDSHLASSKAGFLEAADAASI